MKTWHKIAIAVVVIVGVLISVKSCVDKETFDLMIAYVGDDFINHKAFYENIDKFYSYCNDIDNDGEINIGIMEISFNENLGQADRQNASSKLTTAVGAGVARLYFMEEEYVINNAGSGMFADITELGDGFKNPDGEVIAINIKGNKKASEIGINTDSDLYLVVRVVSEMDTLYDKNIEAKHNSAIEIAKYILS